MNTYVWHCAACGKHGRIQFTKRHRARRWGRFAHGQYCSKPNITARACLRGIDWKDAMMSDEILRP